jgi:hypothetical protein
MKLYRFAAASSVEVAHSVSAELAECHANARPLAYPTIFIRLIEAAGAIISMPHHSLRMSIGKYSHLRTRILALEDCLG